MKTFAICCFFICGPIVALEDNPLPKFCSNTKSVKEKLMEYMQCIEKHIRPKTIVPEIIIKMCKNLDRVQQCTRMFWSYFHYCNSGQQKRKLLHNFMIFYQALTVFVCKDEGKQLTELLTKKLECVFYIKEIFQSGYLCPTDIFKQPVVKIFENCKELKNHVTCYGETTRIVCKADELINYIEEGFKTGINSVMMKLMKFLLRTY